MTADWLSPDWLTLGPAALAGLLGGVHCAAMCGGIATGFGAAHAGAATALPPALRPSLWRALQPNLGRVLGYVLAGAIAGGIGHGIVGAAGDPRLTLGLRMAVGAVLVLVALRLLDRHGRLGALGRPGAGLWQRLRPLQRRLLPADTVGKRLALGMLWGWLPCGLSTTLLAAAWLQASAVHGALTMAAFGLGTLPLMVSLTWSGARLGALLQRGPWRTVAASLVLLAGLATIAAPWLMQVPALHDALSALGCRTLPG